MLKVIYITDLSIFMEISRYDKDSLVGISVFVAIASLLYFFLDARETIQKLYGYQTATCD